jgi:cytoskeleton protein RodZ
LKLSPAQVEALEAGRYERLPGRVFVRGFLRNYAKLVHVDPQPLLRSIDGDVPKPELTEIRTPDETVMPRGERARWPLYSALAVVFVVGCLAIYEFGFNNGDRSVDTQGAAAPAQESAPAPVPGDKPAEVAGATAGAAPSMVVAHNGWQDDAPADGPVAKPGERQLHLRFDQDSWVEIRDGNNKVIFAKLNKAGREENVIGSPPFRVVVGNARGVRLTYDEKPVDLAPHTGVTVARLTLE